MRYFNTIIIEIISCQRFDELRLDQDLLTHFVKFSILADSCAAAFTASSLPFKAKHFEMIAFKIALDYYNNSY